MRWPVALSLLFVTVTVRQFRYVENVVEKKVRGDGGEVGWVKSGEIGVHTANPREIHVRAVRN